MTLQAPSWEQYIHAVAAREARIALAKQELARRSLLDFTIYFHKDYKVGWFHRGLCELLDAFIEAVERQLSPRLILNCPPRHGKSQLVSINMPAYCLGKHPDWEIVCATYNQELATTFGGHTRTLVSDPRYLALYPELSLDNSSRAKDNFTTYQLGGYYGVGIGGGLTGRGAHILDIDDPVKDQEEADSEVMRNRAWNWYNTVASTRLHPGGGKIVTQTRWHEDDLTGRVLERAKESEDGSHWTVHSFPALAEDDEYALDPSTRLKTSTLLRKKGEALHPERYSVQALKLIKADLPARDWSALYQQNPIPPEGVHFKNEEFDFYTPDRLPANRNSFLAIDLAISARTAADFTVIWPFSLDEQGELWFLKDIIRERGLTKPAPLIRQKVIEHNCNYIVVEGEKLWLALKEDVEDELSAAKRYPTIEAPPPTSDPVYRASPIRGAMQRKKVHFPVELKELILREWLAFPVGKNDDTVSAGSWAGWLMQKLPKAYAPLPPPPEAAPPWSHEWMKSRTFAGKQKTNAHTPAHLNGKPRKRA